MLLWAEELERSQVEYSLAMDSRQMKAAHNLSHTAMHSREYDGKARRKKDPSGH